MGYITQAAFPNVSKSESSCRGAAMLAALSRRGAAAYGDAHMVGTCRRAAGAERPPAAERRLTVWPICCLEGSFPYKNVILSFVARGRSPLLPPNTVGSRSAAVWEAAPRQEQPLRGWCVERVAGKYGGAVSFLNWTTLREFIHMSHILHAPVQEDS